MDESGKKLTDSLKSANESWIEFNKAAYHCMADYSSKLRLVSSEDDFLHNFDIVYQFPEEHNEEFLIMVTQGLSYKEAFDLLKDTYSF